MEKPLTKKQQTQAKILEAASQSFRSNGYAGIGVDGIAKAAGVTSGAFYAHFGSKDGAFNAAVIAGLDEVVRGIPMFQEKFGKKWVEEFADYYLGKKHQENLSCGCAMTTLSPEVVRADADTHAAYEKKMSQITDLCAKGLKGENAIQKQARSWSMLSVLIGGLTITRAMKSKKIKDEIADAVKETAIIAAGETI